MSNIKSDIINNITVTMSVYIQDGENHEPHLQQRAEKSFSVFHMDAQVEDRTGQPGR